MTPLAKNTACCLAAVLSSLGWAAAPTSAANRVFLLAGQSNMLGCGGYGDSLAPAPYNTAQPGVRFWSNSQWTDLNVGFGYGTVLTGDAYRNCFGPEVSFGYKLKASFPQDTIYLIKYAVGSTNLINDWNSDGSGRCYNTFKSTVDAALKTLAKDGQPPAVAGMIWMQGESDALTGYYAPDDAPQQYATNLERLVAKVRSDFGSPKMAFVLGRITTHWGSAANNQTVRTAQETVPTKVGPAAWINTDDLGVWDGAPPDTAHYNTQGQINLGIRFADAMVATVPEPSTGALATAGLLGWLLSIWRKRSA